MMLIAHNRGDVDTIASKIHCILHKTVIRATNFQTYHNYARDSYEDNNMISNTAHTCFSCLSTKYG